MTTIPRVVKDNKVVYFSIGVWRNCFYTYLGYRPPNRGEFYLSGAEVQAYRAYGNLETAYHVVQPTDYAISVKAWKHGKEVKVEDIPCEKE